MNKSKTCRYRAALAAGLVLGAPLLDSRADSPAMEIARRLNEAFIEVADQVSPSVVVVEVAHRPDYDPSEEGDNPLLDMLPPELRRRFQELPDRRRKDAPSPQRKPVFDSRGSGIVLRDDGWILTNDHVVQGAEKVRVKLRDGRSFESAEGKWFSDPQSDIAVIKIEAQGLKPARLADSAKIRVGEFAIAIGAPFDLDYSVTFGHVSAKGRNHVIPSWMANMPGASMDQDFIQTDASINPGNSGGPLVNINGEVMGVNTLIKGLHRGIGFAIPANLVQQVAGALIAEGKFTRAWLGIQINALKDDPEFRELAPGVEDGVVVKRIMPNGPAAKSSLKPADIITAVEGVAVSTAQDLRNEVRAKKIGSPVSLSVLRPDREGKFRSLKIDVRSEAWPEESLAQAQPLPKAEPAASSAFGLSVQTLTEALAEKFGVEGGTGGVIVTGVEPDSPAARERFKPGDIITEIDRKPVASAKEFREAIKSGASKGVLVQLISEGAPEFRILKGSGD